MKFQRSLRSPDGNFKSVHNRCPQQLMQKGKWPCLPRQMMISACPFCSHTARGEEFTVIFNDHSKMTRLLLKLPVLKRPVSAITPVNNYVHPCIQLGDRGLSLQVLSIPEELSVLSTHSTPQVFEPREQRGTCSLARATDLGRVSSWK